MQEGSASTSTSSSAAAPRPTESVEVPPRGTLEAGRYEAPSWAFYVAAAAVVVFATLYFSFRLGAFKRAAKGS